MSALKQAAPHTHLEWMATRRNFDESEYKKQKNKDFKYQKTVKAAETKIEKKGGSPRLKVSDDARHKFKKKEISNWLRALRKKGVKEKYQKELAANEFCAAYHMKKGCASPCLVNRSHKCICGGDDHVIDECSKIWK